MKKSELNRTPPVSEDQAWRVIEAYRRGASVEDASLEAGVEITKAADLIAEVELTPAIEN